MIEKLESRTLFNHALPPGIAPPTEPLPTPPPYHVNQPIPQFPITSYPSMRIILGWHPYFHIIYRSGN